jgi:ABC-type phosphate transport system auxiliary subunit
MIEGERTMDEPRTVTLRLEVVGAGEAAALIEKIRSVVLNQMRSLSVDLSLPQFGDKLSASVDRLVAAQSLEAARHQSLQDEIAALRAEFRTYRLRTAA